MATSGAKSRWGSFLQQAVAGVEARLDNILAESDDAGKQQQQQTATGGEAPSATQKAKATTPSGTGTTTPKASSVSTSSSRTNDRLQERLARAVAGSSTPSTPRRSQDTAERPKSSTGDATKAPSETVAQSTRPEAEKPSTTAQESTEKVPDADGKVAAEQTAGSPSQKDDAPAKDVVLNGDAGVSHDVQPVADQGDAGAPGASAEQPVGQQKETTQVDSDTAKGDAEVTKLRSELEQQLIQHQEEIHQYVERVDALEAKLRYLAREASDSARKAALAAPAGSLERKLGEKDQKISQLMEEGQNLASAEQKYRMTIKKLRAKAAEDEGEMKDLRAKSAKLEADLKASREKLDRANASSKAVDDLRRQMAALQKELENSRNELASKDTAVSDLKAQLKLAHEQAAAAVAAANDGSREQDRRRIQDLEESVAALQVEKNLLTERHKAQIRELEEKSQRAAERAKAAELEAKGEIQALEAKLEAMRATAEEVSTGVIGDTQAKLLRQIETLQSQYTTASENWRGIEATLIARAAELERERDESRARESEMRKKAREASARARRVEEELEGATIRLQARTQEFNAQREEFEALQKRVTDAEGALAAARAELEQLKSAPPPEKAPRDNRDRSLWGDEFNSTQIIRNHQNQHRPESPLASLRLRNAGTGEPLTLQTLTGGRLPRASVSPGPPPHDDLGSAGRRSSTALHSLRSPQGVTQGSVADISSLASPAPPENPLSFASLGGGDADDPLDGILVETPSSPPRPGTSQGGGTAAAAGGAGAGDVISVSTVGAGPSVQLVERMSAAIRRLESEKVAMRDELARVSAQRDDARAEIVLLMGEVEAGRNALKRVAELEAEVANINSRYQTTLEMLGEKSELVEELRADVEDVKAMYRELVERTVK